jgi:hypothetical protein
MSNRFHSKFHRQNHHTYSSATNPDAGHDPIASPEQPFIGDFVLSGALSCVATASAVAGFFSTNNTALCALAGYRGIYIKSPIIGGEFYSTAGSAISAYGSLIGGDFYSGIRGIRTRGATYGIDASSSSIAVNGNGTNVGGNFYSSNIALSAYSPKLALLTNSPLTGASINGNNVALITNGNGVNVLNNITGINKFPNSSYSQYALDNIVLDLNGDLFIDGNTLITGNLSALGDLTQLDVQVQITSSIKINNVGNDAALTVVQTGAQPIFVCYDKDVSSSVPSFLIDGASNGWVSLGTATPTAPLTIQKSTNATQGNNQPQIRITDNGTTNKVSISTPITNFPRSYIGTETNTSFDIVTNSSPRITLLNNGNVGIGETNPGVKLAINGSLSANNSSTFTVSGASPALLVQQYGSGVSFRVDDTVSDKTPFIIDTSGNVGVGTLLPSAQLSVNGAISANNTFNLIGNATFNNSLNVGGGTVLSTTLNVSGGTTLNNLYLSGDTISNSNIFTQRLSAYDFVLNHPSPNDGVNPSIFIGEQGDGSVGTIAGSLSGFITLYDELQNKYVVKTQFGTVTPISAIVIDQLGNVGINNTASPSSALSVSGDITATGNILGNAAINNGYSTSLLNPSVTSSSLTNIKSPALSVNIPSSGTYYLEVIYTGLATTTSGTNCGFQTNLISTFDATNISLVASYGNTSGINKTANVSATNGISISAGSYYFATNIASTGSSTSDVASAVIRGTFTASSSGTLTLKTSVLNSTGVNPLLTNSQGSIIKITKLL